MAQGRIMPMPMASARERDLPRRLELVHFGRAFASITL